MEEEDQDKRLLSSLGVTSAIAEDIERKVLSEAKTDTTSGSEPGEGSDEEEALAKEKEKDPLHSRWAKLYSKLHAVEVEIDAVASSIEKTKVNAEIDDEGTNENASVDVQVNSDGLTLQQALAVERLKSLNKTRKELRKEISNLGDDEDVPDFGHEKLLDELVRERPKRKRKLKEAEVSAKNSKKHVKTVAYDEDSDFESVLDSASVGFVETERDELIRKGVLTPFHKLRGFERRVEEPGPSHSQNVSENNELASSSIAKVAKAMSEIAQARPTTKLVEANALPPLDAPSHPFQRLRAPLRRAETPNKKEKKNRQVAKKKRPLPDKKWRNKLGIEIYSDESDEDAGKHSSHSDIEEAEEGMKDEDDTQLSINLEGGLKIPLSIYNQLFDYQKVGVQWLWELHCQKTGGIIGDEMGLGKTIQVISFLGALHYSKMYKPSIVVCPLTLLRQWQREVRKWYPKLKVEIIHDSAHVQNKNKSSNSDESDESLDSDVEKSNPTKSSKRWNQMIDRVVKSKSGLLLTTYEQLRILGEKLLDIEWGYAILDEGHRIRNPNAEITLVCKQLQTVHRIIMTGAPIQNQLSELWSLFDFVFPGKLGVLPVFEMEFAVPIKVGGYANATPLQVSTAYRCAVVLRDLIMPYLLRRMKIDVNAQLPKKTEHVLFCSLTQEQRSVYRSFLASSEVEQIFDGSRNSLYGIDIMRKICNHPDLLERGHSSQHPDYGNPERSGKMKVISQVLKVWKEQGNRVLLFSQTQQMLDIIENFLIENGYTYRRMDGQTPVKQRMALIDEFNNSDEVYIFILTTKVGGLGTNLTGANRVIIYDPDWNPSTDIQARERAWRIGQKRDVIVYRLITRGTIEEKVYHRQIYKHFLTNKILTNPQQRRFFKARDMKDLFTLQDDSDGSATETSNIFGQLSEDVHVGPNNNDRRKASVSLLDSSAPDAGGIISMELIASSSRGKQNKIKDEPSSPHSSSGEESVGGSNSKLDEETDILKKLFEASGIHSALNHDAIVNANDDDKMRLEQQASQVAQRAAEALRESRILRSRESIAVPTWTGRSGAAGAPTSLRRKFGSAVNTQLLGSSTTSEGTSSRFSVAAGTSSGKALSSAELLARIRATQEKAISDALQQDLVLASSSNQSTHSSQNSQISRLSQRNVVVQPEILARQLCTFIQQRGGSSDSVSITQHFKDRIRSEDLPLFKNLLKQIATLEKDADGTRWVLRPDFRQQ